MREDSAKLGGRTNLATRSSTEFRRGRQIHDALPAGDGVAVPMAVGEKSADVEQPGDVQRIETQNPGECLCGVGVPSDLL